MHSIYSVFTLFSNRLLPLASSLAPCLFCSNMSVTRPGAAEFTVFSIQKYYSSGPRLRRWLCETPPYLRVIGDNRLIRQKGSFHTSDRSSIST